VDRIAAEETIRVLHLVAGLEPSDGGPAYSVPRLCRSLAEARASTTLFSIARGGDSTSTSDCGFVDRRLPAYRGPIPLLNRLRFNPALSKELDAAARQTDVIHNHGLWLLPNLQAGWAASHHGKPFIVAPRGMLSPAAMAYSGARKKLFWHLLQKAPVRAAACLHVTSLQEYHEVRSFGLTNPVAIIPNGIDLPEAVPSHAEERKTRIALALGRIHPKKGLDRLIRAWAKVEPANPNWRLRIVGPSEGRHEQELRALSTALNLTRVTIEGPVYGPAKYEFYRNADLFILPTLSENFAMTVAEALASGVPVISTKGAPWSGLKRECCGWWIEHGVEPMAAALHTAIELSAAERRAMGMRGRAWMARDYSWERVAADMLDVYRWISIRADRPRAVRLD
jgi:glycosyltransferase involved in cell wall biosynthesis